MRRKQKFSWYNFFAFIVAMIGIAWFVYDYINLWHTGGYAVDAVFNGFGFIASCCVLLEVFNASAYGSKKRKI